MDLPVCHGTFTNESNAKDVPFLQSFGEVFVQSVDNPLPYYPGLCIHCQEPGSPLQRCKGCQLVAYCSRTCQKGDWVFHKLTCKEFPVVSGKNVLQCTGSWKDHITDVRERAARLPEAEFNSIPIFQNPRVCRTCKEARQDRLTDCSECAYVTYCSRKCRKAEKNTMRIAEHLQLLKSCKLTNGPVLYYQI